ncbi:MAG: hypothetical protein WC428_00040 [Candidatus Paceibacterota bacterium]
MKPREFSKIMTKFVEEDKRWRALKVGDTIYDEQGKGMDVKYHKMIIDEIDLEEREIIAHNADTPIKFHNAKLDNFLTEKEFDTMFNPLIKD